MISPRDTVKYCRDCHFARNRYFLESEWRCAATKNVAVSPTTQQPMVSVVTGASLPLFESCVAARSHNQTGCGHDAHWFLTTSQFLQKHSPLSVIEKRVDVSSGFIAPSLTYGGRNRKIITSEDI